MQGFNFGKELILPDKMRRQLGKVHGKLIRESEIDKELKGAGRIYAVGDATVSLLLRKGHLPDISIFDYRIGRRGVVKPLIKKFFPKPIRVRNRSGTISKELWNAVKRARGKRGYAIFVSGEEDMAAVPCAYFAPLNSLVIYGLPGKGLNLMKMTPFMKKRIRRILVLMKKS